MLAYPSGGVWIGPTGQTRPTRDSFNTSNIYVDSPALLTELPLSCKSRAHRSDSPRSYCWEHSPAHQTPKTSAGNPVPRTKVSQQRGARPPPDHGLTRSVRAAAVAAETGPARPRALSLVGAAAPRPGHVIRGRPSQPPRTRARAGRQAGPPDTYEVKQSVKLKARKVKLNNTYTKLNIFNYFHCIVHCF